MRTAAALRITSATWTSPTFLEFGGSIALIPEFMMASENVGKLLDELRAAISVVEPEIRGLESLANDTLSGDTLAFLRNELNRRNGILGSYRRAVEALEALSATFPEIPDTEVPIAVAVELDEQRAAIMAAVADFVAPPPAESMAVDLGEPEIKA